MNTYTIVVLRHGEFIRELHPNIQDPEVLAERIIVVEIMHGNLDRENVVALVVEE